MAKKGGYVYVLCDPATDLFKIGMTKGSVEKRLKNLQTGNGTELHVVTSYHTDYPYKLEKMLHNHFHLKKEMNEWFTLTNDDILDFNGTCSDIEEVIKSLTDNPFFNPV